MDALTLFGLFAVTAMLVCYALERFPTGLNRLGFPNHAGSDSSCLLAKEAGRHGASSFD
jgi:hypothetical protein